MALTKQVMQALDVRAGDYVTFQVTHDGMVLLRKVTLSIAPLSAPYALPSPTR